MFLRFLFSVLFLLTFFSAFTQPDWPNLIPYRRGNLWGYCDSAKRVVIKPAYDSASIYQDVYNSATKERFYLALVVKKKKMGLIDITGQIVLPAIYDNINLIDLRYDEKFVLTKGRKTFLYSYVTGKIHEHPPGSPLPILEPLRDVVILCDGGKSSYSIADKGEGIFEISWSNYGDISKQGYKIPATNISRLRCSSNMFLKKDKQGWGLIRRYDGIELLPCEYDSIYELRNDDLIAVYQKKAGWYILKINYYTNDPSERIKSKAGPFKSLVDGFFDNLFLVATDSHWAIIAPFSGMIGWTHKIPYYSYIYCRYRDLIAVFNKKNRLVGYIGSDGSTYWD